jgi:two-component system phosphate regulon sensor histidine kinase PhoR
MKKTFRLIWQLYPTYLFITLIAIGAVSWYTTNFLREYFFERTLADLKSQGRIAEVLVSRHLKPLDGFAVDQLCKKIGQSVATRITVIAADGTVIGDSDEAPQAMDNHIDRPEVVTAVTGEIGSSQRYSRTLDKRMMYVALPLQDDDGIVAVLRVSIPLTEVDSELASIQDSIAIGGVLIAFIASLICFYVSRRISQPIERLKAGAEKFAKGNLSHRLQVPKTQETAGLAEAMNFMAERLEKRIEAEINQRNEMGAILSSMTEGVMAIDMDEHVLSFNQAAADIVRGLKETSKGMALQEVVRNLQLQQLTNRARENNVPVSEDIMLHQADQRIVNVHATPMRDSRQARIGTLLVLNDVTQLRHLEKMRQDFVSNVSHEIKTPLTAIKGFVETLQNTVKESPEESSRFVSIIGKHAKRLEAIVEDLLQLSRIEKENEAKQIQFQEGSIRNILRSSIQICLDKAESKGIDIELSCDDALKATINAALLEQAFINLIDNAIKYSGEGGRIVVKAEKGPMELAIVIQDNGIGIPQRHLPRLFERFYRVDKARSREQGGTGLGLAIVKHIVRAHGGHVTVESQRGKGSTFTIHLPSA